MSEQQTQAQAKTVEMETSYHFRKNKETGIKRETVTVTFPVPSAEGIIEILQDRSDENKKTRAMVLETVQGLVSSHLRTFVDADDNFSQDNIPALVESGELTLQKIANLPKSERNTTTKEDLEAFASSYIKEIVKIDDKVTQQAAEAVGGIFVQRLKTAMGNDDVLRKVQFRLGQYLDGVSPEIAQEHEKAISYLATKLDEALSVNLTAEAL